MSWFNVEAIKGLSQKVQNALPTVDFSMLEKLTLTTPELTAERHRIDEQERRKERVRDMLAGLLPWETRDEERDILVDECKEAILQLSSDRHTFFGPYVMPEKAVILEVTEEGEGGDGEVSVSTKKGEQPTSESLVKLAKLEPLPALLRDFDLDAHVGLINRLLKEDPELVEMQSALSGGGERERVFWQNYFFHCAYTRYEAGLSIDEIWSDERPSEEEVKAAGGGGSAAVAAAAAAEDEAAEEETITFEGGKGEQEDGSAEKAFPGEPITDEDAPFTSSKDSPTHADNSASASAATSSDYEIVAEAEDGAAETTEDVDHEDPTDYELDELEAEIARELED